MMAGYFTGEMPFKDVYIHGLVRDENNQKMSKSKGNGIDPLILIDKYGTDALRYAMIREVAGAGQDIRMAYDRQTDESASVEAARNFTNKLWNAARFVMLYLDEQTPAQLGVAAASDLELADRWILSRFNAVTRDVSAQIEDYGLGEAAKALYEFIWGDFCDWYIELVKPRLQDRDHPESRRVAQQTIAHVLDGILKLLHPFLPHITEEIWQTLCQVDGADCLATQAYPQAVASLIDPDLEQDFELLFGAIRTVRNLRAEVEIKPSTKVTAIFQSESDRERQLITSTSAYIQHLARVETLTVVEALPEDLGRNMAGVVGTVQVVLPLEGIDLEAIRAKLEKSLQKAQAEVTSIAGRLGNAKFVSNAPAEVVQGARDALAEAETQVAMLTERLERL